MNTRFNPQKFLKITRIFAFIGATIALAQTALSEPIKFSPTEDLTIGIKNPAILDGGNMLEGSTSSDKWNRCVTIDGRKLSAEKNYTVKFSYLLPPQNDFVDRFIYLCVRKKGDSSGASDYVRERFYASRDWQEAEVAFSTDKEVAEYEIRLDVFGKTEVKIKDLSVESTSPFVFLPIETNINPLKNGLKNLPTGAKEFDVDLPKPEKEIVVNAEDFGVNPDAEDCATKLNAALEHCKKIGASKLVLKKGRYKIFEEKTVLMEGFADFTIEGGGATLVYRKRKARNMEVRNCRRIEIRNLNFDWDWETDPLGSLVEVVGMSTESPESFIDFKFYEYEKFPQRQVRVANLSCWDDKLKCVGYEGGSGMGFEFRRGQNKPKTKWISDNVLRVYASPGKLSGVRVGNKYRMQHNYYEMGGILLSNNTHTTLRNVNIFSCAGQAIVFNKAQKYTYLKNVSVDVPEGIPRRPLSSTADHLIFSQSAGFVKLEDCDFGFGCDDCINMHDNSLFMSAYSEKSLRTRNNRNEILYRPGETLELRYGDFSPTGVVAKVVAVRVLDAKKKILEVEFDRKLPEEKFEGFILFNTKYGTRNVIVRNCYFHQNRARGVLILAKDVTIENCRFYHNEMGAIKIETGYTYTSWCEGYGVKNVLIRNNTFDTSNPLGIKNGGKERDVYISIYMRNDPSNSFTDYPIISDILFEGNTFKDSFGLIAYAANANNLAFIGNTFLNPTPRKNALPYRGSFQFLNCRNVLLADNVWIDSPNISDVGVFVKPGEKSEISISNNKITVK